MRSSPKNRRIGIALSGGGVRAAAFHAGVLHWLAEQGYLEEIRHISSVSGGSLFTGLVFHASGYKWPTSEEYLHRAFPSVKEVLTRRSLQNDAILRLTLNPMNWRFLFSRANILAQSIESNWDIRCSLGDLPNDPVWSINGTTAENGRRFRFKDRQAGDYEIGYADVSNFSLAKAMSLSAAFPGGIGPFALETKEYIWQKRKLWDSENPPRHFVPSFKRLHLYDGGLYDNLGIEPLFDIGQRIFKKSAGDINHVIVSDAGAPLIRSDIPITNVLELFRIKRFMNIVMDQARALRVRVFVNFLQQNPSAGMYLQIGSNPRQRIDKYLPSSTRTEDNQNVKEARWLSDNDIKLVATLPTTLKKMNEKDFDTAAQHGYETAQWNHMLFSV